MTVTDKHADFNVRKWHALRGARLTERTPHTAYTHIHTVCISVSANTNIHTGCISVSVYTNTHTGWISVSAFQLANRPIHWHKYVCGHSLSQTADTRRSVDTQCHRPLFQAEDCPYKKVGWKLQRNTSRMQLTEHAESNWNALHWPLYILRTSDQRRQFIFCSTAFHLTAMCCNLPPQPAKTTSHGAFGHPLATS
jgi:hypothetical protein